MRRSAIFALLLGSASVLAARAGDFSIENKVYDGRDLVSSSTTLFIDSKAYDFLSKPDQTIIVAPLDGRIVLLDNARKVRTDVALEGLAMFCDQLRTKAERASSEAIRFYAAPEFREQIDPETKELVLASAFVEYRARTTSTADAATLKNYDQYMAWQARLNSLLNPGAPPPTARLKLNEALARRQVVAEEVTMRRTSLVPGFGKTLRAEHRFTWSLGEPDRRRIDAADTCCGTYRVVPPNEYLNPLIEQAKR